MCDQLIMKDHVMTELERCELSALTDLEGLVVTDTEAEATKKKPFKIGMYWICLLYTSPSPRD